MFSMTNQKEVYEAARDGHLHTLQMLMVQHSLNHLRCLTYRRTKGMTPLLIASRNGHVDVVEYLLDECGADPEQIGWANESGLDVSGAEALWWATHHRRLNVVRCLLTRGANVDGRMLRYIPLVEACVQGDLQIVKYLIANGACLGAPQSDGSTALHKACLHGHHRIVSYLIRNGSCLLEEGADALHICMSNLKMRCFKCLLRYGVRVDAVLSIWGPLMFIRRTENPLELEFLLGLPLVPRYPMAFLQSLGVSCVDINSREPYRLPHHRRTVVEDLVHGHRVIIEPLNLSVEPWMNVFRLRNSDVDHADDDFETVSYYSSYEFDFVVDRSDERTEVTKWEMMAAMQRLSEVPVAHLTHGTICALSAFFVHSFAHRRHVVYELVVAVFYVSVRELGMRVLGRVEYAGTVFTDTINCLRVATHVLCCLAHLELLMTEAHWQLFVGVVLDMSGMRPPGCDGATPLHVTCDRRSSRCEPYTRRTIARAVEMLLDAQADPRAVDDSQNSPLHYVAMHRPIKHELIRLLLSRGAHFHGRNASGQRFIDMLHRTERSRYVSTD